MRVNLISHDNGVGLSRDIALMRELLTGLGHTVVFVHWTRDSRPADLNIFLEVFHERHFDSALRNIGVFNLEWLQDEALPYLQRFDQLWAKSMVAHEWFIEQGLANSTFTGFMSRDMLDRTVPRKLKVLHVKGRSYYKGTESVLEAYRRAGDKLPPLEIVSAQELPLVSNTKQWLFVNDDALSQLMNECRIHLVPSEVEGWGHVIAEGISCKAIVITTDASPMFEHVLPSFGWLLPSTNSLKHGRAVRHFVDPNAIISAIQECAALDDDTQGRIQLRARIHWAARQARFKETAKSLLARL